MSDQSCNPSSIPPPTEAEFQNAAAYLAQSAGITTCKTTSKGAQASYGAEFNASAWGASAGGSVNASASTWNNTSSGCEQSSVAATQIHQAQKAVACILNNSSATTSKNTRVINSIVVKADRDIKIPNLVINQTIKYKQVDLSQLSNQQKSEIASAVQMAADSCFKAAQSSFSGVGATPQGQKALSEVQQQLTNENFQKTVNDTITSIKTDTDIANNVVIQAGRDLIIDNLDITQDLLVDITSTSIVQNSITSALSSIAALTSKASTDITQTAKNLGAEELGTQAGKAMVELGKARVNAQAMGMYGPLGLIVVVLLVMGLGGRGAQTGFFGIMDIWKIAVAGFIGLIMVIAGISGLVYCYNTKPLEYRNSLNAQGQKFAKCITEDCLNCGENKEQTCEECRAEKCPDVPTPKQGIPKYEPPSPFIVAFSWIGLGIGTILIGLAMYWSYKKWFWKSDVTATATAKVDNTTTVNIVTPSSPATSNTTAGYYYF